LFGNGVFSGIPTTTPATIANGTSNINIVTANGNILFSANNNANLFSVESGASLMNAFPLSTQTNALRINTIGNPLSDSHRVAFARSRGTLASPTSVQANDIVGSFSFFGHNGTSYQTNSVSFIRAVVDSSYSANTANIPIGLRFTVNQSNNVPIVHNLFANGLANFASDIFAGANISYGGNLNLTRFKETTYTIGNVTGTVTPDLNNGSIQTMTLTGNITLSSLSNVQAGSSATLILKQDGTGNRILTSTMKFASGQKTLSTGANATDIMSVFYDGSTYYATLTTGYA
jgi:hypothetical protein